MPGATRPRSCFSSWPRSGSRGRRCIWRPTRSEISSAREAPASIRWFTSMTRCCRITCGMPGSSPSHSSCCSMPRGRRRPRPARDGAGLSQSQARPGWGWIIPAGVLYGLTCFLAFVEGATVPLGLPAAVLILVGLIVVLRHRILTHNLVGFFFLGYSIALLLLAVWGIYWKGFPELSEVGLL